MMNFVAMSHWVVCNVMSYYIGVKLKDVYNHGLEYVKSNKRSLADKLTKNFG